MDNIKLIVFDIDGTLVDRSKQTVEDSAVVAINSAREKGYHILVATGRSFFFIHQDVIDRVNTEYYVTVNGACLNDNKGNILETHAFSQKTLDSLIAFCVKNNYPLGIKYNDHVGVYGDYDFFVKTYTGYQHKKVHYIVDDNKQQSFVKSIPLGVYTFAPDNALESFKSTFKDLHFTPTDLKSIEATKSGVDKTKTIDEVVSRLGLTWDNVVAFGDGHNDIEMLQRAKVGVAMGNASDFVKSHADYVTDTVLEDGISKAFKHLKLL